MCQMSLHILNFNFQLCSVPEIYIYPHTEHKVFIHIRTYSSCHKTIKHGNILKYYLINKKLYSKFQLNVLDQRYRPAMLNIKTFATPYKITPA